MVWTHGRVKNVLVLVDRILSGPEPHSFQNGQHVGLLAWRHTAFKLLGIHQLALDCENGLLDSARLDLTAWSRRQTRQSPLAYAIRRVDTSSIGCFDEVFADNVNDALAALH